MQSTHHTIEGAHPSKGGGGKISWYISLGLMLLILAGTLALWLYSIWQIRTISSLGAEITTIEDTIKEVSKDRNVLIAHIVSDPRKVRQSLDVSDLVKKFRDAAELADVRFRGFTIQEDKITTSLIANADQYSSEDAVVKLIKMMRDHKQNVRVLSMKPVEVVSGDPKKRTTSLELTVTPIAPIKK